ncbi:MAG TPA: PIN domain-containing protein [Nevskiaceae bacterium]|nr:PIN domain-containing protein [Nevskiaceae bacterium]
MIFIDASFYLSLLNPNDSNHEKAVKIGRKYKDEEYVTTQMVLGEVLTVGSQRFNKVLTVRFVGEILKSRTRIVFEKSELVKQAFVLFKKTKSKNISWVDCYSLIVMKKLSIRTVLTFNKHLKQSLPL